MLTISSSFLSQRYGLECRICGREIHIENWLYKGSKCMLNVHIDCAKQGLQLLNDMDESNMEAIAGDPTKFFNVSVQFPVYYPRPYKSSFILPHQIPGGEISISLNEIKNENRYLKHFSHKHPLVLIRENNDNGTSGVELMSPHNPMKRVKLLCDGCVRPITTMPFYKCSQECSNFVLHQWCAWLLPQLQDRDVHDHTLVLRQSCSLFCCKICGLPCNGFTYSCDLCEYYIDVYCAVAPKYIVHEASINSRLVRRGVPQSFMYEDLIKDRPACRACHNIINEGMTFYTREVENTRISGKPDFYLDMLCAVRLTQTIRHKYDKHPLKLSYFPIKNHTGQYFCEVCEEDLNPEKWFYHCSKCDQSIHSACSRLILKTEQCVNSSDDDVVYKFINMKFDGLHDIEDHEHSLSFVAGTRIDGDCSKCVLKLQSKFILKCLQCKFAIHSYCQSSVTESAKQQLVEMFNNREKKRESTIKPRTQRVFTYYPKEITRPVTE